MCMYSPVWTYNCPSFFNARWQLGIGDSGSFADMLSHLELGFNGRAKQGTGHG